MVKLGVGLLKKIVKSASSVRFSFWVSLFEPPLSLAKICTAVYFVTYECFVWPFYTQTIRCDLNCSS